MILVQRQALLTIVSLAARDPDINKRCIDAIVADLQHQFLKQHGKPEGDIYVDQEVKIEMPFKLEPVMATEFKCANSVYSSRLYMYLKLAIALISSDPNHLSSDKAFHILYHSSGHFLSQHSQLSNRTLFNTIPATGVTNNNVVQPPVCRDSRHSYVSA